MQPLWYHTRDKTMWPHILLLVHSCFCILWRSWCTDGTICLQFLAFKFVSSLWILDMYPVVMWMVACNDFPLLASRAASNYSRLQSLSQNLHNQSGGIEWTVCTELPFCQKGCVFSRISSTLSNVKIACVEALQTCHTFQLPTFSWVSFCMLACTVTSFRWPILLSRSDMLVYNCCLHNQL